MSEKYVAAIDLGSYKIVGAVAKKSETGIEVLRTETEYITDDCFTEGKVKSADRVALHVSTIMHKLSNATGITINHIYLNWNQLDPKEKMSQKVAGDLLKQVIVIYPEKTNQEMLIETLTTEDERKRGVLLIDFGDTHISYSFILDSKVVHQGRIPGGSRLITTDLQELFEYDYALADKLKCTLGKAIHINEPDKIIKLNADGSKTVRISELSKYILQRVEDLFQHIIPRIIQSKWNTDTKRTTVLAGGGAALKHIDTLMQQRTGLTTRVVNQPDTATLNALLKFAEKACDDERPGRSTMKRLKELFSGKKSDNDTPDMPSLFAVDAENEKM